MLNKVKSRLITSGKKYLLLIVFCIPLIGFSQTSVYHPFPDSNAYWRVNYYESPSNPCTGTGLLASYQYTYDGDTVINGNMYKKILKSGSIFSLCYPGTPLGYQGAFREDTVLKKTYLVLPGDTADSLLYDFNLQVGDTVNSVLHSMSIYGNNCAPYIITALDSQLIGSSYRKRWTLGLLSNPCVQGRYVEGVGNFFGFLDSYYHFEEGPFLLCFSINNQPLYSIGPPSVCNPVSVNNNDIANEPVINNTIFIIPNPVSDYSLADISGKRISTVNIFNILGERVTILHPQNNNLIINAGDYHNGSYLLKAIADDGLTYYSRFTIMD